MKDRCRVDCCAQHCCLPVLHIAYYLWNKRHNHCFFFHFLHLNFILKSESEKETTERFTRSGTQVKKFRFLTSRLLTEQSIWIPESCQVVCSRHYAFAIGKSLNNFTLIRKYSNLMNAKLSVRFLTLLQITFLYPVIAGVDTHFNIKRQLTYQYCFLPNSNVLERSIHISNVHVTSLMKSALWKETCWPIYFADKNPYPLKKHSTIDLC